MVRFRFLDLLASLCTSLAAFMYRIHIHTARQHVDLWFFSHASKCDNARGRAQALCVLSHTDTCRSNCCPLNDLCRQRSWQAAILVCSAVMALSWQPSLLATIALLETHTLVFWHRLHPWEPHAPSPFKFTQQSTSLFSCPVGKNISRIILFEWVILFK